MAEAPPVVVKKDWALAIHGGVESPQSAAATTAYEGSIESVLSRGQQLLDDGEAALRVVDLLIRQLEDDPVFNAGRGATFTRRGTHELDAAIMDGRTLACGSVAGLRNIRNPVELAHQVLKRSPEVLLVGDRADEFSRQVGARRAPQNYFTTQPRFQAWQQDRRQRRRGTRSSGETIANAVTGSVGVVALDRYGNLAAGSSVGGATDVPHGQVSGAALIGSGVYADNQSVAVSATGKGDQLIRHAIASDLASRVRHGSQTVTEAATELVDEVLEAGDGGLIAIDRNGAIAINFNTPQMIRAAADSEGLRVVEVSGRARLEDTASAPEQAAEDDGAGP